MAEQEDDRCEAREQEGVKPQEVRVVKDQNGHPHEAAHHHVHEIHQQRREGSLHQHGFQEIVHISGPEALLAKAGKLLRQRQRQPREDPLL